LGGGAKKIDSPKIDKVGKDIDMSVNLNHVVTKAMINKLKSGILLNSVERLSIDQLTDIDYDRAMNDLASGLSKYNKNGAMNEIGQNKTKVTTANRLRAKLAKNRDAKSENKKS
jgi:hypothetical protein